MSGKKFKKLFPNYKPHKIISESFIHNNYKYKLGLNIDSVKFNPTSTCFKGGLYLSDLTDIHQYLRYGPNIGTITILDDSKVYLENNKIKVDKLFLDQIQLWKIFINNQHEKIQCKFVKSDGYTIQYISNPSEQVQLEAIKHDEYAIQYISNPSEQVQLEAVKSIKYIIHFILYP
jgi:hypothetical protein